VLAGMLSDHKSRLQVTEHRNQHTENRSLSHTSSTPPDASTSSLVLSYTPHTTDINNFDKQLMSPVCPFVCMEVNRKTYYRILMKFLTVGVEPVTYDPFNKILRASMVS